MERITIKEYVQTLKNPLQEATLLFLIQGNQILLAMKNRGFGEGKINGVGGKRKPEENIRQTVRREAFEEICVRPDRFARVAILDFFSPHQPESNLKVMVYLCSKWTGVPTATDEMTPKWHDIRKIPYGQMWPDDIFWLPDVLSGKNVRGYVLFDKNWKIIEQIMRVSNRPGLKRNTR